MKSDNKRIWGLIFLAIPLLAMLGMIGLNIKNLSHQEYRVEITGYDPRDLLKGHYLIFRYVWPAGASTPEPHKQSSYSCACFSGDPLKPDMQFINCNKRQEQPAETCEAFINVSRAGGEYQPYENMRRYYIPEKHAPMLERMLRSGKHKFSVGIVPREGGEAQIKMMYVDDVPLDQFLQQMPPEDARADQTEWQ